MNPRNPEFPAKSFVLSYLLYIVPYKMEGRGIKTRIITEEEFVS